MQVSMSGQYPASISTQSTRSQQSAASEESSETSTQKAAEAMGQGDTVKLSLHVQVKILKKQGMSIAQIARNLGLDAKTVNTYLYGQASGTGKVAAPQTAETDLQKPEAKAAPQGPDTTDATTQTPETTAAAPDKSNSK
jgi:hypothetical protein